MAGDKKQKDAQIFIKSGKWPVRLKWLGKWLGLPLLIYFLFFSFFSWPWIIHFNSHFFTDAGDGLQNVWNIWWVDKSVGSLHQLPWHTSFLHYPHGVTLLGQTLNPFNGFVAIGLLNFMSLTQAFNFMVIFSFMVGGLTAFWLCYYFSKSYIGSLIGGFIFTFSSYHFAHAIGHMQLVSLEWIPLFILLWWVFLKKPRYSTAVGAALALWLVLMCDYYYFLYCVVAAGLIFVYLWRKQQLPNFKLRSTILPLITFIGLALLIVAPLPLALLHLNSTEVLSGSHPARALSTNIFAPLLDGGFWRFGGLTDWYWRHVPSYVAESSVYLGISVIVLVIIAFLRRRRLADYHVNFWLAFGLIFGILSFGPRIVVGGNVIERLPLPYALAEKIFPPLKLSGVPVRMMVMVTLATAVIAAIVLSRLKLSTHKGKVILGLFVVLLAIEMWPSRLPLTPKNIAPAYVYALESLPAGAVFDNGTPSASIVLYNQTIHQKPIALGYISRTPKSVEDKDWSIVAALEESHYQLLCSEFKLRYYTTPTTKPLASVQYPIIYQDSQTLIYDLKNSDNC